MDVYFWMMLIGGGYVLLSFVVGEVLGFAEHGLAHHGIDSLGHHGGAGGSQEDNVSVLSPRTVAGFLAFFGAAGEVAAALQAPVAVSLLVGSVIGFVGLVGVWKFTVFIVTQSVSSHATDEDYLDQKATVDIRIPATGVGRVSLVVGGQYRTMTARSETGDEIPKSAEVLVREKEGGTLVVIPFPEV